MIEKTGTTDTQEVPGMQMEQMAKAVTFRMTAALPLDLEELQMPVGGVQEAVERPMAHPVSIHTSYAPGLTI
jgi:hypothetical protein